MLLIVFLESDAERLLVPAEEAPPYGFFAGQRLRNKTLQKVCDCEWLSVTQAAESANCTTDRNVSTKKAPLMFQIVSFDAQGGTKNSCK